MFGPSTGVSVSCVGSKSGEEGAEVEALLREAVDVGLSDIVSFVVVRKRGVSFKSVVRGDNDIVVVWDNKGVSCR